MIFERPICFMAERLSIGSFGVLPMSLKRTKHGSFVICIKVHESYMDKPICISANWPSEAMKGSGASDTASIVGLAIPTVLRTAMPEFIRSQHHTKLPTFVHPVPKETNPKASEYDISVFYEWAYELHEWLGLAILDADRLNTSSLIDPLLSRYNPPISDLLDSDPQVGRIAKITWKGLIPADYVLKVFNLLNDCVPPDVWFALTVHGFHNAPVSWKARQHSVTGGGSGGGENTYTIQRRPEETGDSKPEKDNDTVMADSESGGVRNESSDRDAARYIAWEVIGGRDEHS